MITREKTSAQELAEKWVNQQLESGKTAEDLHKTMFVYGDSVMEAQMDEQGTLQMKNKNEANIVIFRTPEPQPGPMCRCCGMDYDNEKEALQCCAYID
ncbi:MAG: hypothetical protein EA344_02095 [Alkalicoccus sp.]|nr:MAG: hypothetical protein EA344_02095 [Alkalicoccus sp.]